MVRDPVRAVLGAGDPAGGAVQRLGDLPAGADGRQPALHDAGAGPGEMLRATLIDAALCVVAILVGLPWGVTGVAASIAVAGAAGPSAGRLLAGDAPRSGVDGQHHDSHRAGSLCRGHGRHRRVVGASRGACRRGGADGGRRAAASVSAAWSPSALPCWRGRRREARSRACR